MSELQPCVAYLRKSTKGKRKGREKQEESIPRQREEIERWASSNGYHVTHWYVDEDSGGKVNRKDWLQMREDAVARAFTCPMVVWKLDRFSRMDVGTFYAEVQVFRKAHIRLLSTVEGEQDWFTDEGLLMLTIRVFQAAKYRPDLSLAVSSGMAREAAKGKHLAEAPYGYMKDEALHLIPNPETAPILREIFHRYGYQGQAIRSIVRWLNDTGIPSPKGLTWTCNGVTHLLKRQAYLGRAIWNLRNCSEWHIITGGKVTKRPHTLPKGHKNAESDHITSGKEQDHEPLVDKELWLAVQRRLADHRGQTRRHKGTPFLFAGRIFCAVCGCAMYGCETNRRKSGSGVRRFYICSGGAQRGGAVCRCRRIQEPDVLRIVVDLVYNGIVKPFQRGEWEQEIEKRMRDAQKVNPADVKRMRADLAARDAEIAEGTRRWLKCPPSMMEQAAAEIDQWKAQRAALAERIASAEEALKQAPNLKQTVRAVADAIENIDIALTIGRKSAEDMERKHFVLEKLIDRIDVSFEDVQVRTVKRIRVSEVSVKFKPDCFSVRNLVTELTAFLRRDAKGIVTEERMAVGVDRREGACLGSLCGVPREQFDAAGEQAFDGP